MEVKVVWARNAFISISKILQHVSESSPANAGKIAADIEKVFKKIIQRPLIYPPDKYKTERNDTYRAFELHSIRISYKIEESRIIVVRCRHTKQKPSRY